MSPPQPFYPPPRAVPTSGAATASLLLGLFGLLGGWCLLGLPCFAAILCGHLALRETRTGERGGHGMAVAGLILGYTLGVPMAVLSAMLFAEMVSGRS